MLTESQGLIPGTGKDSADIGPITEVCFSKIRNTDFLARSGGEEFVLLPRCSPALTRRGSGASRGIR